ncbi:MAG: hypothetical protein IPN36_16730, partial [Bacteroidetes bacterium]|nr:hypothetical protein [Bacteroidota bacterium]
RILFTQSKGGQGRLTDLTLRREKIYKELGLHLPDFYLSIGSLAIPDSFSRIQDVKLREAVVPYQLLVRRSGEEFFSLH